MTTLGIDYRDETEGSRWGYIVAPAVIAPVVLGCFGASIESAVLSIPAAAMVGTVWRGKKEWLRTSDPTVAERHWVPVAQWERIVALAVVGFFGVLAFLSLVGNPDVSGWAWFLNLAAWGGALAGLAVHAFGNPLNARREGPSDEDAALSRVSEAHWVQCGLSVKSPNSGLHITPDLLRSGHDENGNPFYVARLLAGEQTLADWHKAGPRLASAWEVPRVSVTDEGTNLVRVTAILHEFQRTEPVEFEPVPNPEQVPVVEYVKALPMGAHAFSPEPWTLSLYETHWLIGGVTRMGKSVGMNDLIGHLARHPHIEVSMIDLKRGVEAEPWRSRLSGIARTPKSAVKMLAWAMLDMHARFDRMRRAGVKNAWTHPGFLGPDEPLKVLVIDELAELFDVASAQSKMADDAETIFGSFMRMCSAAGWVVISATQRPSAKAIPTGIRSQAGGRMAYRCEGGTMAALILGDTWYGNTSGAEGDPSEIGPHEKGMVVIKTEDGRYVRMQTAFISDETVREIAADTAAYRVPWDWKNTDVAEAIRLAKEDDDDEDDEDDEPWADDDPEPEPVGGPDEPPTPSVPDLSRMVYGAEDEPTGEIPRQDPDPEDTPPRRTGWEF